MLFRSTMGRAALFTVLLTTLCKFIGFLREQSVAAIFGVNVDLDTFYVALLFPTLIATVILQKFSTSLVMATTRAESQQGREVGMYLFRRGMFWGIVLSLLAAIMIAVFSPTLLRITYPSLSSEVLTKASQLMWWMCPFTVMTAIAGYWSSYLNSQGCYVATSLSTGVISLTVMASLWLFPGQLPVDVMVLGFSLGAALDLLNLAFALRRAGLPILPLYSRWDQTQSSLVMAAIPLIIGSMMHFGTEMLDQSMAAMLGEGSISELKYGNRIVTMVFGVLTIPITQVVFPRLVQQVEQQQWSQLRRMTRQMALALLAVSIPITAILIVLSQPIVAWSFERGHFTPESTMQVAAVQVMYAFQLPFYLVSLLLARVTVALRMNRVMLFSGGINLTMNAVMNWILMKPLGVTGIALSTAVVQCAAVMFFAGILRSELRRRMDETGSAP